MAFRIASWISDKRKNAEPMDAWVALVCSILTYFVFYIPSGTFGILFDDFMTSLDASRRGVSWVLAIHWICVFITGEYFIIY